MPARAFRILARSLRKAKTDARRGDLAARKALHVLHDHAQHRPPTPEMLRKYWLASRNSLEGQLLLGSLMGDLAVTVDASYVRGDDGEIVGRQVSEGDGPQPGLRSAHLSGYINAMHRASLGGLTAEQKDKERCHVA